MSLIWVGFLLAQAAATPAAPGTAVRALTVSFVDERGAEVVGLGAQDVALLENGVARDITSFKPDGRPLAVVVLVDSSAALGASYRLNVVEAVVSFVKALPEGARYALWTTGDRPTRIVDFTEDRSATARALERVAPQGGNTMLDAVAEAAGELAKAAREGERRVIVAVSGSGPELSSRDRHRSEEETLAGGAQLLAVHIADGGTVEDHTNLGYVFDRVAKATGGRYEDVLTPMAVEGALRKLSAVIKGSYRLAYATVAELPKRKLELRVARPGTKVLLPATSAAEP